MCQEATHDHEASSVNICPFKVDYYSSQLSPTNFYWVLLERKTPWWGARPRPCPLGLKSFVQSRMLKGAQGWVEYLLYPAQGNTKTKLVVGARTGHPVELWLYIPSFSSLHSPGCLVNPWDLLTHYLFMKHLLCGRYFLGCWGYTGEQETMSLPSGSPHFCERRHAENKYIQC